MSVSYRLGFTTRHYICFCMAFMRIGVDARLIYHQPFGISKYTLNLLQAFAELNACSEDTPGTEPIEYLVFQHRRHVTPVIDRPHFRRASLYSPIHTRLEQLTLPVELRFHDIDLLHSTDFIPPLRSPVPTVITVHDLAFLHWPHFLTKDSAAYYGQIDRAVNATGHIIVPSESTRQDLIGQFGVPDSRVSVIYEAANPQFQPLPVEEARREVVAKYKIPERYILYVGTIEPRKNVDGLLRAYKHLRNKYAVDDVGLVIRGSFGWLYEETLNALDELDLRSSVYILGRVPDEQLWKLYVGARCHVHAAHYEGFGLPPLEAMACGTPTIVSNVSSLPEVVGDAALLVDPNNWEEIAVAINRLLSDDDLHAELREKGLQRANCFSWTNAAKSTLNIYKRILGKDNLPSSPVKSEAGQAQSISSASQPLYSERISPQ